ncbi:unnamed protein product [Sphagnum jensenii]|uniref:Uncharacterized protein n=1 Tax=Sphagnum jensenii TaxID=128206 RepID=A0ABP0WCT9_9BRYO
MAVGRRATDNRAQDDITMMQTVTLVVMSVMTAPLSSVAMAALSGLRETSMAKDNATNVALQLGAASLQIVLLRRCTSLRVATTLRRCSSRGYNTAALQYYSSRCCDAMCGYDVAML